MTHATEGYVPSKQQGQPRTPSRVSAGADAIVDNRKRRVGDFLLDSIKAGSNLSIVSAYFTIYAYEALGEVVEKAGRIRFLYGEPTAAVCWSARACP